VNITIHPDAQSFVDRTLPSLRADEAANNLILGIALRLERDLQAYSERVFMATMEQDQTLAAAALMTPPYNLVVYCAAGSCSDAWLLMVEVLQREGWQVPGVLGVAQHARDFSNTWQQVTGQAGQPAMRLRTFVLREVTPPPPVPGSLRLAVLDDLDRVHAWSGAFQHEATPHDPPPVEGRTRARIASGEIFLWDDGQPVCMAATARPLEKGISIGLVYTPPEQRRMGYASALVADLSQRMLDSGFEYCSLFTDLANPTSNAIYQRIGYRPVCDYAMYRFGDE
jgi:predicted GNAT family acetyltransferase